jgi:epoxyqueuosine reductase QueG
MSLYDSDLVGLDNKIKEELPFAVSFGLVLSKSVLGTITDGPTQLYLHHYRQLNYRLDMIGYLLSREIEKKGFRAMPFAASQVIDWQHQRGHISHKKIGVIAGVGWIGRNNLLIDPVFGAQARYNTVLTDMPFTAGKPLDRGCGVCMTCVNTCPAFAIKEQAEFFDHKGCYEMLGRFRKERNIGHHICGICVSACKGER